MFVEDFFFFFTRSHDLNVSQDRRDCSPLVVPIQIRSVQSSRRLNTDKGEIIGFGPKGQRLRKEQMEPEV